MLEKNKSYWKDFSFYKENLQAMKKKKNEKKTTLIWVEKNRMCLVSGSLGLCGTTKEHYFGF